MFTYATITCGRKTKRTYRSKIWATCRIASGAQRQATMLLLDLSLRLRKRSFRAHRFFIARKNSFVRMFTFRHRSRAIQNKSSRCNAWTYSIWKMFNRILGICRSETAMQQRQQQKLFKLWRSWNQIPFQFVRGVLCRTWAETSSLVFCRSYQ
jgi:hypothetical protein